MRSIILSVFSAAFFSVGLLSLSGCDKDEPGGGGGIAPLSFPFRVGNSWKYYTISETVDSNGSLKQRDEYYHYWSVEKDTLMFGAKAFKMLFTDSMPSGQKYSEAGYYTQNKDGLYLLATLNNRGTLSLKREQKVIFSFFETANEYGKKGDMFVPDSPVCVLKYPYQVNKAWTNRIENTKVWRRYLPVENVYTPAGAFSCYVHSMWLNGQELDQNFTFRFYYGSKGLIQSTVVGGLTDINGRSGDYLERKSYLLSTNF